VKINYKLCISASYKNEYCETCEIVGAFVMYGVADATVDDVMTLAKCVDAANLLKNATVRD